MPTRWKGIHRPTHPPAHIYPITHPHTIQYTRKITNKRYDRKQAGWKVEALSDVFHMSQWYRLHSCMLLGLREADHPNMLPNTARTFLWGGGVGG